jgi:hypothetical protein
VADNLSRTARSKLPLFYKTPAKITNVFAKQKEVKTRLPQTTGRSFHFLLMRSAIDDAIAPQGTLVWDQADNSFALANFHRDNSIFDISIKKEQNAYFFLA